ncbi:19431_t:CDS:2, partial [Racocetra persica]
LGHRTLIHLEQLNDPDAVTTVSNIVNWYYFYLLENPSHQSKEFWTNFIKHFGAYARNNLLPFTSSNTAKYYVDLYTKLSKLSWGPFAPRAFRVFSIIAINFNTISDYHWDDHDEPNSLCVLVALGDFEGGELCFSQLQVVVHLRPGQVVVFASRLLLHNFDPTYLEARIEKANGPIVSEQNLNNA